jgi:Tol biopolymer transport system component
MNARILATVVFCAMAGTVVLGQQAPPPRTLVWVDRSGNEQPVGAPARPYANPRISPDGRRLAVTVEGSPEHLWVCDLPACSNLTQFTTLGTSNDIATWAPDGRRLAYRSNTLGKQDAFWQMADGSGGREQLSPLGAVNSQPRSFTPNGAMLAIFVATPATAGDIWFLRMNDRQAFPFLATPALEGAPRFSPDGNLLTYISSESGAVEVYLQQLLGIRARWQVSRGGGVEPVWNPNGRELLYRSGSRLMAVDVTTTGTNVSVGQPRMLFDKQYQASQLPNTNQSYDVSADGQRFLMLKPAASPSSQ